MRNKTIYLKLDEHKTSITMSPLLWELLVARKGGQDLARKGIIKAVINTHRDRSQAASAYAIRQIADPILMEKIGLQPEP